MLKSYRLETYLLSWKSESITDLKEEEGGYLWNELTISQELMYLTLLCRVVTLQLSCPLSFCFVV